MTNATWLSLCLDVNGPEVGGFWATAIGGTLVPGRDADDAGSIHGPDGLVLELCSVPEPKAAKHRVHLDVHTDSIETLVEAGARVVTPSSAEQGWTVMVDPEDGELCAFVREQPPTYRLYEVGVDSADPEASARWWGEQLGVEAGQDPVHSLWWLEDVPGMPFESLVFVSVPEPKTVKNRIHWDVRGDVADLERAGARVLSRQPRWTVMADPEGNEFCVFAL